MNILSGAPFAVSCLYSVMSLLSAVAEDMAGVRYSVVRESIKRGMEDDEPDGGGSPAVRSSISDPDSAPLSAEHLQNHTTTGLRYARERFSRQSERLKTVSFTLPPVLVLPHLGPLLIASDSLCTDSPPDLRHTASSYYYYPHSLVATHCLFPLQKRSQRCSSQRLSPSSASSPQPRSSVRPNPTQYIDWRLTILSYRSCYHHLRSIIREVLVREGISIWCCQSKV